MKENKIVMEVVFIPKETLFLKYARENNCKIIPGHKMLIYQALFQFELWTGKKASPEIMGRSLIKHLE